MKKKLFAMLLTFAMVFTYMPAMAFAGTDADASPEEPVAAEAAETAEEAVETDADAPATAEEPAEEVQAEESAAEVQAEESAAEEAAPAEETAELEMAEGKEAKADLADLKIVKFEYAVGENGYKAYIGSDHFFEYEIGHEGDSFTLTFDDGTTAKYIARNVDAGYSFFLNETTRDDLEIDSEFDLGISFDFADENQETFKSGDNAVYFVVNGVATENTINVVGIEKPEKITGITYTPAANADYSATANGTDVYNFPCAGDVLTITFEKHSEDYTYVEDEAGYSGSFVDSDGSSLTYDEGYSYVWGLKEGQNKFTPEDRTFEFILYDDVAYYADDEATDFDYETKYAFAQELELQLEESFLKSVTFINGEPLEVSATAEKETDKQGVEWTYYEYDQPVVEGDQIEAVFKDGKSIVYTAAYTTEGFYWYFETDAVDPMDEESPYLSVIEFTYYDNQIMITRVQAISGSLAISMMSLLTLTVQKQPDL